MNQIRILILDDEETIRQAYIRAMERFNAEKNGTEFIYYEVSNLDEANNTIKEIRFDAAIVDLTLDKKTKDIEGNIAIKSLIENFRMPIFVVSAYLEGLEEEYEKNPLITSLKKASMKTEDLLLKIIEEIQSHVIQFYARNGFLEKKINEFYWNHLSHTFESWEKVATAISQEDLDIIISRHTITGINEDLYNISPHYHGAETYIIPSIKAVPHTGNIVKKDDALYVILTPACDIAEQNKLGKLSSYALAKIESVYNVDTVKSKSTQEKQDLYIRDTLRINQQDRYHYLPQFDIINESVIDFQSIINVEKDSIDSFKSQATITTPFLKDIQNRFSTYFSRQGQPNYKK